LYPTLELYLKEMEQEHYQKEYSDNCPGFHPDEMSKDFIAKAPGKSCQEGQK
jgi:hypothetical protein